MIRIKIFEDYGVESDAMAFIQEQNISRDQIISINLAIDSEAHRRIGKRSTQQIMLVWEDNK